MYPLFGVAKTWLAHQLEALFPDAFGAHSHDCFFLIVGFSYRNKMGTFRVIGAGQIIVITVT